MMQLFPASFRLRALTAAVLILGLIMLTFYSYNSARSTAAPLYMREDILTLAIQNNTFDRYDPVYHNNIYRKSLGLSIEGACQIPSLNPWDKSIWPHLLVWLKYSKMPQITCKDKEKLPPLTYLWNNTHIRINESAVHLFKNKRIADQCTVGYANKTGIVQPTSLSTFQKLPKGSWFKIADLEQFIIVRCGRTTSKKLNPQWQWDYVQFYIRLVVPPAIEEKVKKQRLKPSKKLSVLYLFHDGVSHLAARRSWNKTYYYLVNQRNAFTLHRYHSVGLNTFPNVVPWLTGRHVAELPKYKGKHFNDLNWPFVWKNFSAQGYITAYVEDSTYQTFNYLKKGFTQAPTDYYFESFFNLTANGRNEAKESCCSTGVTVFQNHLRMMNQFLDLHGKNDYLYLTNINSVSHFEAEPLASTEVEHMKFFKRHFDKGTFNNTLLIVGSDHGNRFGPIRQTSVGRTEERLPLHLLIFPEWYRKENPEAFKVLQDNAFNALTTPFDMHETLLDVVSGEKIPRKVNSKYTRGMSLFRKIPLSRTCPDAGIPTAYCVCRNTTSLPTDNADVIAAAAAAVTHINKIRELHADICETWELDSIINAQVAKGTSSMTQSKDTFNDYIIIFELKPAQARFEATVRKHVNSKTFRVEGGIARISLYGKTAACITSNGPEGPFMRNFCYCKKVM